MSLQATGDMCGFWWCRRHPDCPRRLRLLGSAEDRGESTTVTPSPGSRKCPEAARCVIETIRGIVPAEFGEGPRVIRIGWRACLPLARSRDLGCGSGFPQAPPPTRVASCSNRSPADFSACRASQDTARSRTSCAARREVFSFPIQGAIPCDPHLSPERRDRSHGGTLRRPTG